MDSHLIIRAPDPSGEGEARASAIDDDYLSFPAPAAHITDK